MVTIALYSNNSRFFTDFSKKLENRLRDYAPDLFRFWTMPLSQTSLFSNMDTPPDLCIVDLRDDPSRGMQFAASLRRSSAAEVMVVSSSPDYAMDAYNADILSFMLDPPDPARTAALILRRFTHKLPAQQAQFSFRTSSGAQVLAAERIVYVEYSNHRMLVYTDSGKKLVTNTMRLSFADAAAQLLEDRRFVRTHASFIVNITHIAEFGLAVLQMDTGVTVPVSHAKRKEVKEHFNSFFTGSPLQPGRLQLS